MLSPSCFLFVVEWILDKKYYICNVFETEITRYDELVVEYQEKIVLPMGKKEFREYSEILFSCHSCGIEGSSFSVDDTRCLFEEQLDYLKCDSICI